MAFKDPQRQKEYLRDYYKRNRESLIKLAKENPNRKINDKKYHVKNKSKNNKISKEWNDNNKEYKKELARKYYLNNKESIIDNNNEYQKERRKKDNLFRLKCRVRSLISNSINRKRYKKNSATEKILGCTFNEFKLYIESKFETWMTWENYGLYNGELNCGWDIDHIIPNSHSKSEDESLKLNHYSNLQPLCSKVNRDLKINKTDYAYC